MPGKEYQADEAGELFDKWTGQYFCKAFGEDGVREEARRMFMEKFEAAKEAGGVVGGRTLFIWSLGGRCVVMVDGEE